MPILSVKLKNAINKALPDNNYEFHLKNIIINGSKCGCSGFIVNNDNKSIIYLTTESASHLGFMYRYADSITDYTGYRNRWSKTFDNFVLDIIRTLTKTPEEAGDKRM